MSQASLKRHRQPGISVQIDDQQPESPGAHQLVRRLNKYVDDEKLWETDAAPSHTEEFIILSLEVGKWAGDIADADLPDDVLFDYVRVYQKPERAGE